MPLLLLEVPGRAESMRVELPEGRAVLVGRAPDAAVALSGELRRFASMHASVVVASKNVSANHALVLYEHGLVQVWDLGSRNGTWMRIPTSQHAASPCGAEVRVQLASPSQATSATPEPDEPHYRGREDYSVAISTSVERWLKLQGIGARLRFDATPGSDADEPDGSLPLATGGRLRVEFEHTVTAETQRRVEALWAWITRQNRSFLAEEETREDGMILASAEIRRAHRLVVESAQRGIPSLVFLGPTGAGKERLARAYHRHSGRSGLFVAVNCGGLDRELARADLFGAEIGAYTGCTRQRIGAVERAHGGTLFLDEVGDMTPEVQTLLLRFLDGNGEFERMGGNGRLRHADVRVVCATNKNLREESQRGNFRKDLWWRLSIQVVEVPALQLRFDDIVAFLRSRRLGTESAFDALQPAALELFRRHSWEGNFRELSNCVTRLPPVSRPHEIDEAKARQALEAGALTRLERPSRPSSEPLALAEGRWGEVVSLAAAAFSEDRVGEAPMSWADVATFTEQYLKPVVLRRLVDTLEADGNDPSPRAVSQVLQVDSKTVAKHLRRYTERFERE